MRKVSKSVVSVALLVCISLGAMSGIATATTKRNVNGCDKLEYGVTWMGVGKPYAASYIGNHGWNFIDPHWASVYVHESGNYAAKDTPYRGWTAKAKTNTGVSVWRTFRYTASCGKGYK